MKFNQAFLSLILILLSISNLSSQNCSGTSPSSHPSDQIIQGPCYVFATVAAIEAESGQNFDLSEWYFYSRCVFDAVSLGGENMIEKTIDHMNTVGALFEEDFFAPVEACPFSNSVNPASGGGLGCIFVCENGFNNFCNRESPAGCPVGMLSSGVNTVSANDGSDGGQSVSNHCEYQDSLFVEHHPAKFVKGEFSQSVLFNSTSNPEMRLELLNNQICDNKTGVVLIISDYSPNDIDSPAPEHAIYVYRINGSNLTYKDSWPGAPSVSRTMNFDPSTFVRAHVVVGTASVVSCIPEPPVIDCDCDLVGPATISGATTFNLVGECDGNRTWNFPSSLSHIGGGGKFDYITLLPSLDSCFVDTVSISVNTKHCILEKEVYIDPNPVEPDEILLFAQEICPGDIVELNVIDDNAAFPATSYAWNVGGGSISSGQGSPTIFVQVSSAQLGGLNVKVKAINECGESETISISIPLSKNCDKGGEEDEHFVDPRSSENEVGKLIVYPNPSHNRINLYSDIVYKNYVIYDITNSIILETNETVIGISNLTNGVYIIKGYSSNGKSEVVKFLKL